MLLYAQWRKLKILEFCWYEVLHFVNEYWYIWGQLFKSKFPTNKKLVGDVMTFVFNCNHLNDLGQVGWLSSVSSNNKIDRHDITDILLKVA